MKKKKWLISVIIVIILIISIGIFVYNFINDEKKLTSEERTWIDNNINNVQNVYVIKDENIFAQDGHGVFYKFLEDFQKEYGININIINKDENTKDEGISLDNTNEIVNDKVIFYTDHYVLLSKDNVSFNYVTDLNDLTIGVLNKDLDYLQKYLKDVDINYNTYDTVEEIFEDIGKGINYVILPRIEYLDDILKNDLNIVYHLSDINKYYILYGNNDIFYNILNKYFIKWQNKINKYIKEEEFLIFKNSLGITDKEIDSLLSVNYQYGFINNSPYEVIMSGNYGGIIARYLQEFSEFSGVYFDITKYKNTNKLINAINKNKIDLYFSFNNNIEDNYLSTINGINSSLSILTRKDNLKVINSIYGLQGEEVYVEENSHLYNYLKNIPNINIKTYKNKKELFKLNQKDTIICMDTYIYNYYSDIKLTNYISKYDSFIDSKYTFKVKDKYPTLYKLLDKYINYLDDSRIINDGVNSHNETMVNGNILNNIAKYFIIGIILILLVGLLVFKKSKRIRVARRLKKDEKIRFIDELTCLKNRAYLSDFIKTWNNNTIYPQTVIVIDLNNLKEINDKFGVSEGDKQIQAAANAIIKTQLDNSDLMRSDGNEFVIYTIGYSQKQIVNYIHKLNKEFKKLPYDYGAEFGYSMIESNLKTIEDALSEALISMREKKESGKNEK